eukprot:m51a1_g13001 hypothetical protein (83) ;mRNA; f:1091-1732
MSDSDVVETSEAMRRKQGGQRAAANDMASEHSTATHTDKNKEELTGEVLECLSLHKTPERCTLWAFAMLVEEFHTVGILTAD